MILTSIMFFCLPMTSLDWFWAGGGLRTPQTCYYGINAQCMEGSVTSVLVGPRRKEVSASKAHESQHRMVAVSHRIENAVRR